MKYLFKICLFILLTATGQLKAQLLCQPEFTHYKLGKTISFYNHGKLFPGAWLEYNFGDSNKWTYQPNDLTIKTYATAGKYKVCLKDSFCTDANKRIFCDSIEVYNSSPVSANFTYRLTTTGEIILSSQATSSFPMSQIIFDMGDGNTIDYYRDSTPYNYHSSGSYEVCSYAFDKDRNYNQRCSTINVIIPEPCYASFHPMLINGKHFFHNQSVSPGDTASYLWNFGDSTTSTEKNPYHQFPRPGTYEVVLQMSGFCNSTFRSSIVVPEGELCKISLEATAVNQRATIQILDSAIFPFKYFIDFGDGRTDGVASTTIKHVYEDTGTYIITINGFHPICGEIYAIDTLRITSLEPICIADFITVSGDTSTNSVALYTVSGIKANGNRKTYNYIYWGDGSLTTDSTDKKYFEHQYDSAGVYGIILILTNNQTCSDTAFRTAGAGPFYPVSGKVKRNGNPAPQVAVNGFTYEPIKGVLNLVYSTYTDDSGYYELPLQKGYYIIQSDFAFDPFSADFYLPTYYGDKLNWTQSDVLYIVGKTSNLDINQIGYNRSTQSQGQITGTAVFGRGVKMGNQTMQEGHPVDKMLVFLLNSKGKPVAYTHTDSKGEFSFTNTGIGNFTIWAEMPGKATVPPTVYLKENSPSANGIKIVLGQTSVTSVWENGLNQESMANDLLVYPNPAENKINIVTAYAKNSNQLLVRDLQGKEVAVTFFNVNENWEADISTLQPGAYLLQVQTQEGYWISKRFMKIN